MKHLKSLILLFVVFTTFNTTAQKENDQKILGCWVFKKIEYTSPQDMPEEEALSPDSISVCFEPSGKYTTTMVNSNTSIPGKYKVSSDGKTISQQRDLQADGTVDEDASIEFPNNNTLIFKLEFAQLFFERKQ